MIALGIRYLCGYCVASNLARQRPEWPVHPGRVFMAMVAAHFETDADPGERAALAWIESEKPPAIRAGAGFERSFVQTYVPVNDAGIKGVSPDNVLARSRQERTMSRIWLEDDTVYLTWQSEPPAAVRQGLERLCGKVTRIGHSSSFVQMWVVEPGEEPEPNWIPDEKGRERMRVLDSGSLHSLEADFNAEGFGRLDELTRAFQEAKGKTKMVLKKQIAQEFPGGTPIWRRPQMARWQGYAPKEAAREPEPIIDGPFDHDILILTKIEGRTLGLEATLQLTGAMRNAAIKAASRESTPPEWLSGHTADGAPALKPHAAFFPLPYVGAEHSDGHVMGIGVALPRESTAGFGEDRDERIRRALGALFFDNETGEERGIRLWRADHFWEWELARETRERPPFALRAETWTKPSRTWASVTPVVLHHYPKRSRCDDVERIIREAFVSALLPEPESLLIRSVSAVEGSDHQRKMPPFDEGGAGMCRYQTHVVVKFRNLVCGPVLVGRGRYRGYGLFRPINERKASFNAGGTA